MANQFSSSMSPSVRAALQTVLQMAGITTLDLTNSPSFKLVAESRDGVSMSFRVTPQDHGLAVKGFLQDYELDVPKGGGGLDIDGAYGMSTMVSSTIDITVPSPAEPGQEAVPKGAYIGAIATTVGGVPHALYAERVDANTIRVSSKGSAYAGINEADSVSVALVAGTKDIATNVAPLTTDLLYVEQITAGGDSATHYSAVRKNATEITLFAHDAAGALVAGNTATVRAHKFPAGASSRLSATGTLVAGVVTIALPNAVGDVLLVKQESSGGVAASHFAVVRVDSTSVRVFAHTAAGALQNANTSTVRVYNMGAVKTACATLASGTLDIPLVVSATDRLSVREVKAGGDPATQFVVKRKDDDEVTVTALNDTPAKVEGNTSVVQVYNHGTPALETSTIRWTVIRP